MMFGKKIFSLLVNKLLEKYLSVKEYVDKFEK
jgi:hypothetical protein